MNSNLRASSQLGALIKRFDSTIDGVFDRYRALPACYTIASLISILGDFGFIWSLIATVEAIGSRSSLKRSTVKLAASGVSAFVVNASLKAAFKRDRPSTDEKRNSSLPRRRPTSTSFPSGHSLAAFSSAVVLSDSPGETVGFLCIAVLVGTSRIYLQDHYPSDVAGGAVIGCTLGFIVRRLLKRRLLGQRFEPAGIRSPSSVLKLP
ncbi:MAG: phosphatase PAP2 family protein [Actinobacteria bacterium]|nr:phosphatase PAP2 family protein [Actinomycetota bacterium]MCL5444957.1 phosphatase PAP2 family protein [Actinomycetota bacterium]